MSKGKHKRKLRRIVNLRNLAIVACIVLIVVALYIALKPDDEIVTPSGIKVVDTRIKENEEISENDAKEAAVKQFKRLDETVKKEELRCQKIERNQVEYYYITSKQHSLEIKIKGGKIERIDTMPVEE